MISHLPVLYFGLVLVYCCTTVLGGVVASPVWGSEQRHRLYQNTHICTQQYMYRIVYDRNIERRKPMCFTSFNLGVESQSGWLWRYWASGRPPKTLNTLCHSIIRGMLIYSSSIPPSPPLFPSSPFLPFYYLLFPLSILSFLWFFCFCFCFRFYNLVLFSSVWFGLSILLLSWFLPSLSVFYSVLLLATQKICIPFWVVSCSVGLWPSFFIVVLLPCFRSKHDSVPGLWTSWLGIGGDLMMMWEQRQQQRHTKGWLLYRLTRGGVGGYGNKLPGVVYHPREWQDSSKTLIGALFHVCFGVSYRFLHNSKKVNAYFLPRNRRGRVFMFSVDICSHLACV